MSAYQQGLDRNAANYTPLTPVSFLSKAAEVYPERVAVIHGRVRRTWSETYARCRRLASALVEHGVKRGDTVAVMDSGRIVHTGAMRDLAADGALQQRLLGLSLEAHQ